MEFAIKRNGQQSTPIALKAAKQSEVFIQELYVCSKSDHFNFFPYRMGEKRYLEETIQKSHPSLWE